MNRSEFTATAKANGLTVKQLVKLSMIQSEVYHGIRFDGKPNSPETTFDAGYIDGQQMRPLKALEEAGLITIKRFTISVTPKGWAIQCNAGAGVFMGGCSDSDITDEPNSHEPITVFGV